MKKKDNTEYAIVGLVTLLAVLFGTGIILIAIFNPIVSQIILFLIGLYIIYTSLKWCNEKK